MLELPRADYAKLIPSGLVLTGGASNLPGLDEMAQNLLRMPVRIGRPMNLYGVSESGGAQGKGAVFELTPSLGGWTESILYSFTGGSDGGGPTSLLVGNDGNLYGMTASDGANGNGVVFQLIPSANGWTEAVIYDIQGAAPWSKPHSLVQDSAGNLYGEYEYSPCCGNTFGLIFMLTPGSPKWAFTELRHGDEGYFGADVFNTLTIDGGGNLYGTGGGFSGCIPPIPVHGYIFKLTREGDGWHYSTPVYWDNTEFGAGGSLALDAQGNLYGTTIDCGMHKQGTVWQLKAAP